MCRSTIEKDDIRINVTVLEKSLNSVSRVYWNLRDQIGLTEREVSLLESFESIRTDMNGSFFKLMEMQKLALRNAKKLGHISEEEYENLIFQAGEASQAIKQLAAHRGR